VTHAAAGRELHLLDPAVRADADKLDDLLHRDFVEVGASGRLWSRDQVIAAITADPACPQDVSDLQVVELAYGIALVTYELAGTRRSSLWVREVTRWQLRYHQATGATQA
jgi:ribonuclease HI